MTRNLKDKTHGDLFIISMSPEQYDDFDTKIEALEFDEYNSCIAVFCDMLDSSHRTIDPFLKIGRQKDLDV